MKEEKLKEYLLLFPGSSVSTPFTPNTNVYKVKDKIFALYQVKEGYININIKAEPEDNLGYRDIFV
jgi:predicted DNA-binding protein (MmcQ/YjbR family)